MGEAAREELMNRIAGEIILSNNPGKTMKKWRNLFELTQSEVAKLMKISPSVLSDYENSRRRSPGTLFVKKFVYALIEADARRGGIHIKRYASLHRNLSSAIIDMDEYEDPRSVSEIIDAVDGEVLAGGAWLRIPLYGYTVIDSIKAIRYLDGLDFLYLMGKNPMRAFIFTGVTRGRSPVVAARLYPIKPKMIVIHGPPDKDHVDSLAIELAKLENLCFVLSRLRTVDEIVTRLRALKKTSQ
ncbi:MAG: helix-turn-helix domain-containing protein [Thaumarchaeota archaeon]|nr:helix-turn-helix domain-containing protein [Nitrososphaerota archaeon]